jgi:hypothetical protein
MEEEIKNGKKLLSFVLFYVFKTKTLTNSLKHNIKNCFNFYVTSKYIFLKLKLKTLLKILKNVKPTNKFEGR